METNPSFSLVFNLFLQYDEKTSITDKTKPLLQDNFMNILQYNIIPFHYKVERNNNFHDFPTAKNLKSDSYLQKKNVYLLQ